MFHPKKKKKCTRTWPWKANTSRNLTTCHNFTGHWPSSRTQTNHTPWTSNSQKHPRVSLKNHNSTLSETPKAFSLSLSLSLSAQSLFSSPSPLGFYIFFFLLITQSLTHQIHRSNGPGFSTNDHDDSAAVRCTYQLSLSVSVSLSPIYI